MSRGGYATYSSAYWKEYSAFGSDIDLIADGPNASSGGQDAPRMILIQSAGNIVLQRQDGTNITTTGVIAGQELKCQPKKIISAGTTITRCTVYW